METETKKLIFENEEDRQQLISYFESQPDFRIMEYCNRFFLQMKSPNIQAEYSKVEDCLFYDNVKDNYLPTIVFDSLEEARMAYLKYRTKAIIHTV